MPAGSSPKRERQYEHIKDSYEDRGVSTDAAEERAVRPVSTQRAGRGGDNARRRQTTSRHAGRTPSPARS